MVRVRLNNENRIDVDEDVVTSPKYTGTYMYHDGEYYCKGHPMVTKCRNCGRLIWRGLTTKLSINGDCCLACFRNLVYTPRGNDIIYCTLCKSFHNKYESCQIMSHKQFTNSLNDINLHTISKDSKHWSARGGYQMDSSYIKKVGQYQIELDLSEADKKYLNKWYSHGYKFNHYYKREDVNIEGDISFIDTKNILETINRMKRETSSDVYDYCDGTIQMGGRQNKYRNSYVKGVDEDGLVMLDSIDLYGNIKHSKEKINTIRKEYGLPEVKETMAVSYHYVISSNIRHKIKALEANGRFGSCQQPHNASSYAKGAYDSITNGCNCPLLLYKDGQEEPIGRITTRIMYDESGQEYILLERLYNDGTLSGARTKGEVYKYIVDDLKKQGYKVIVSNYSAHDNSTLQYVMGLGLESQGTVNNLCQPLRRLVNDCGYYCDGGTEVLQGRIDGVDFATDYLDKAFIL